jgi:hypothetical protein
MFVITTNDYICKVLFAMYNAIQTLYPSMDNPLLFCRFVRKITTDCKPVGVKGAVLGHIT